MNAVSLTIDGKRIKARKDEKVLWAALDNGIYIPNLCAIHESPEPYGGCRLCFVEIEGRNGPVTACTETVEDGMAVSTKGPKAQKLARTALELLLASHPVDCAHCAANRACELQRSAAHLGVKLKTKRLRKIERGLPLDSSCPSFIYNPNKCVLCGKCVWVCRKRLGIGVLGFAYRGFKRMVTTFDNRPIAESGCQECGDCVSACPVGALVFTNKDKTVLGKSTKKRPISKRR